MIVTSGDHSVTTVFMVCRRSISTPLSILNRIVVEKNKSSLLTKVCNTSIWQRHVLFWAVVMPPFAISHPTLDDLYCKWHCSSLNASEQYPKRIGEDHVRKSMS